MAYHSFAGEVEARTPPRYAAFFPSGRHQLLRIAQDKVVELKIVERASDNTIGRMLKKPSQTASERSMGHPT
jgi:hypothetical protein